MAKDKYWDGTAWQEVGASANKVTLIDNGNIINATDVEGALQEIVTNIAESKADTTSELALRAYQTDLDTTNSNVADNDSRITVQENKLTSPTDCTPELLAQIAGTTAINAIPADYSIVNRQQKYPVVVGIASKNLFDLTDITAGNYVSSSTGLLSANASYTASNYIPVSPSTAYSVTAVGQQSAWYDSAKVFISGGNTGANMVSPVNAAWLRVSITNAQVSAQQIELGSTVTAFESFYPKIDSTLLKNDAVTTLKVMDEAITAPKISDYAITSRKFKYPTVVGIASKNLFDKTDITIGKYVSKTTGALNTLAGYNASNYIPVSPSTAYSMLIAGQQFAWYTSTKVFISGGDSGANKTSPSNASFIRLSMNDSQVSTMQLELGVTVTGYVGFNPTVDPLVTPYVYRKLANKKWNAMGDSFSYLDLYVTSVGARLGLTTVNNYGIGGSTIAQNDVGDSTDAMCLRFSAMDATADIITVFGCTNDFGSGIPMGAISDGTGLQSFKGGLKILIEGVLTQSPNAKLQFITSPQRNYLGAGNGPNGIGLYLVDYVNAMLEVCALYGIPVLDLYRLSGVSPFNIGVDSAYSDDGLHFNTTLGKARLVDMIAPFMSNN